MSEAENKYERVPEWLGVGYSPEKWMRLPLFLRRSLSSSEKMAEAVDNQRIWQENFAHSSPFLGLTPQAAAIERARRELKDWRESLTIVESELQAAHEAQDAEAIRYLEERHNHYSRLLGECLATLGHFDLAAEAHPDAEQRTHYQRIHAAIARDDNETCDESCAQAFAADPTMLTRYRVEHEVFSSKHGQMTPIITCTICNTPNVKPLPRELQVQREARRRAAELAQGRTKEDAARILSGAKLTSEHVFKS